MSPENGQTYFSRFESEHIPQITWQEMIEDRVVMSPDNVLASIREAEKFLTSSPGPNLERRKILVPEWFDYWEELLRKDPRRTEDELMSSGEKLIAFNDLSDYLTAKYKEEKTGMIFVAGAEGHKGHVHAAKYMSHIVPVTIWGFEQESYMSRKTRKASFLPLELRLSMWFYEHSISHLTVLTANVAEIPENEHYDKLFESTGAMYYFVSESDPHLLEKLKRGKQDMDYKMVDEVERRLAKYYTPRVIPDFSIPSTTHHLQTVFSKLRLSHGDLIDQDAKDDIMRNLLNSDFGYLMNDNVLEE